MAVKTPTQWAPPSGNGYVNIADNNVYLNPVGQEVLGPILTQSGKMLLTQSGTELTVNPNTFNFKYPTSWASWRNETIHGDSQTYNAGQNPTKWANPGGRGYIISSLNYAAAGYQGSTVIPAFNNFVTNSGDTIITNQGNYLITTDVVSILGYPTLWTESSA